MQFAEPADGDAVDHDPRAAAGSQTPQISRLEAQGSGVACKAEQVLEVRFDVKEIDGLPRTAPLLLMARAGHDPGERLDLAQGPAAHVEFLADLEQPYAGLLPAQV